MKEKNCIVLINTIYLNIHITLFRPINQGFYYDHQRPQTRYISFRVRNKNTRPKTLAGRTFEARRSFLLHPKLTGNLKIF